MQKYYSKILRKNSNFLLLSTIIIILSYSCSEIISEDISDEQITSILPNQDNVITTNTVNFKWSTVDGADEYQIQVAKPNFTNPIEYTIDSLITNTEISFALSPNNYQWRVRALNNISETIYTNSIDFEVDEIIELTDQTVILNTPQNEVYVNSIQANFTWEYLSAADSYLFQLVRGDEFSNTIIEQNTTTNNFYLTTTQNLVEDRYTWKVRAKNSFSETSFSFKKFYFDKTLPNTPTLSNPSNNNTSTVSTNINFSWNLGVDGGDIHAPITNVLEIATVNNFNTLFASVETENNQLDYTFTTIGSFYWRVKAYDSAGNVGLYSTVRQIIIE